MSGKRSATTELNHDNWNEEHEPEDAGIFTKAADDILEKRVVKTAKRRLPAREGASRSAFGTFTGFKTVPTTHSSPFSFLANTSTNVNKPVASNGASKSTENGANKKENVSETQTSSSAFPSKNNTSDQKDEKIFKKSSDYFAKLKGLNESVTQWIKTHVDANPFCILTPIFRDYERYLEEIEAKHGSEPAKVTHSSDQQSLHTIDNNKEVKSVEKKPDSSPFGGSSIKSPLTSLESKPENSIFGNISTGAKSIFGRSEQTIDSPKSVFSNVDQNVDTQKSIFGQIEQKPGNRNIFGNVSPEKNAFPSKSSTVAENKQDEEESTSDTKPTSSSFPSTNVNSGIFSFGQSSTTSNISAGFSFGSAKPFTFGIQAVKPQDSESKPENEGKEDKDEDDEPPKVDFKPVTEEGAIYEQRLKVFIKKDGNFSDRGIGTLFLKPTPNGKTQLIVRAENTLGNLILNTLLTDSIPIKRMNKNTIMLVCLPKPESSPPPVPVLLRVKTDADADLLLEALNKHKI